MKFKKGDKIRVIRKFCDLVYIDDLGRVEASAKAPDSDVELVEVFIETQVGSGSFYQLYCRNEDIELIRELSSEEKTENKSFWDSVAE